MLSGLSRDRLVVRTLRCGRSNPGSNPGLGRKWVFFITFLLMIFWIIVILVPYLKANFLYTVQTHKSAKVKSIGWIDSIIWQAKNEHFADKIMTPTWLEHAAFWSGVRRATIAPRSHRYYKKDPRPNAANLLLSWKSTCLAWTLSGRCVGGIVVSIAAFQAVDPGSIPGQRKLFYLISFRTQIWRERLTLPKRHNTEPP